MVGEVTMGRFYKHVVRPLLGLSALVVFSSFLGWSQRYTKSDRDLAQQMLREVAGDVQKYYYDPKLHGVDWGARVQEAKRNIDTADSMNGAVSEIAALLDSLGDSHTLFSPPPRTYVHDYGFRMKVIGDRCFVIRVLPGSDAEKKGLKPGDQILAVDEHPVSRKTIWRIHYIYDVLQPQPGLRLTLANEAGHQRQLEAMAKFRESPVIKYFLHQGINQYVRDRSDARQSMRARYFEKADDLLVAKIPVFGFSAEGVDDILGKMKNHKGVVLDLRGNPGGFTDTLDRLLGGIFENDLKIYDRVGRNSTKPVFALGRHHDAFIGRLAVLIDSESESASEVFARVIQLEKRGFIVGDRSAGMVMEAKYYRHEVSVGPQIFYGAEVTDAELLMPDGKTLEHMGVEPDIAILPTAGDVANQRDVAMATAARLVGAKLSPEEAGTIFPNEEPKDW
jgi:C-terminal processing protease CtpA/Prc